MWDKKIEFCIGDVLNNGDVIYKFNNVHTSSNN